eukprot:TRINITY_DN48952_c0_g1_i1.p1 TRINITY_DN48952_c0_g1~~TRINITY_DN48952_c0_g1_i1.p1  ORF type:complete len:364 (+),score=41.93 TRINITY_DN48952_c0_g1_i1:52-1143(+)
MAQPRPRGAADAFLRLSLACCLSFCVAYSSWLTFVTSTVRDTPAVHRPHVAMEAGTTLEKSAPVASEWRLNVGHAIDVLRRDMAGLFYDGPEPHVPDFSIYSELIEVQDARLPSFKIQGIASYQQVLSTLQWSVRTTCDRSKLEITSVSPPVNNQMYMRWRVKLWFKDPRALLATAFGTRAGLTSLGGPFIVEGYSRYEFDPWSAAIVKHTIDITNPPMYLADLVAQYARVPSWPMPVSTGMGIPSAMRTRTMPIGFESFHTNDQGTSSLTGATANSRGSGSGKRDASARSAGSWLPGMPQGCEDDFECNDGKANFPLQCCELPLMGKFCCEPPDDFAQGTPKMPAWVPLPVPVEEEPWQGSK